MELLSVSAQKFYIFAGSDGYCGHRVFCRHRIDAGVLRNQLFQTAQQASAAGQDDTSVRDIRSQKVPQNFILNENLQSCDKLYQEVFSE